jgi:hypothetical protein
MNIREIDQPEDLPQHPDWEEVLFGPITVKCVPTHRTLKDFLPEDDGRRFHDSGDWDERESYEDDRSVDVVVGVGEAPQEE